jgi:YD repeat-containing protein
MMNPKPFQRRIAIVLLAIFLPSLFPVNFLYANNNGPTAPEAASFESVDATDMVNLATGDMTYTMPILNVPSPEGGYPLSLSYSAGIAMDQESSWVGLGWSLNPGAINRHVSGVPDDWGKTKMTELLYDRGESIDQYDFSIGGTLYGVTLGVSKSWGYNKAWGGQIGLGGVGVHFGSNQFALSVGVELNDIIGVGVADKIGVNASYNFVNDSGSLGASYGGIGSTVSSNGDLRLNFNSIGITLSSKGPATFSVGGNSMNSLSTSASSGDYYQKTTSKGFSLGFKNYFWVSYQHTNFSYSLFLLNNNYVSGVLNLYDSKSENQYLQKNNSYMDVKNYNYGSFIINNSLDTNFPYCNVVLPNYDSYSVASQGIVGGFSPKIFEEVLLYGKGSQKRITDSAPNLVDTDKIYITNPSSINDNGLKLNNKIFFYFDNVNSSFLRINKGDFESLNTSFLINNDSYSDNGSITSLGNEDDLLNNIVTQNDNTYSSPLTNDGNYKKWGNRKRDGNFIEVFKNSDIINGLTGDDFFEVEGYDRSFYNNLVSDGIGAYKITTLDGKVYHYSLPVYNFEEVYKNYSNSTDENEKFIEMVKDKPYATHWLLTAVTGPDYVDSNNNNVLDEGDYGYWVKFEYGKWAEGFAWRSPKVGAKEVDGKYFYSWGRKEVYYLDKIQTRTHSALFIKSLKYDDLGSKIEKGKRDSNGQLIQHVSGPLPRNLTEMFEDRIDRELEQTDYYQETSENVYHGPIALNYSTERPMRHYKYVNLPVVKSLKLDKIILIKNQDLPNIAKQNPNSINIENEGKVYFDSGFYSVSGYNWRINPFNVKTPKNNLFKNIYDNFDAEYYNFQYQLESKAIKVTNFDYDYLNGKLSLQQINSNKGGSRSITPPYKFEYYQNNLMYNQNNADNWGYLKVNPESWSLKKIITPTGANLNFEYESDSFLYEAIRNNNSFSEFGYTINGGTANKIENYILNGNTVKLNFNTSNSQVLNANFNGLFYIGQQLNIDYSGSKINYSGLYRTTISYKVVGVNNTLKTLDLELIDNNNYNEHIDFLSRTSKCYTCGGGFTSINICNISPSNAENKCLYSISLKVFNFINLINFGSNGKKGGGLRVKEITLTDSQSNVLTKTTYNYNDPLRQNISGVTSFEPSDDNNDHNYFGKEELISPNVMYKFVTVNTFNGSNESLNKSVYEFNVLENIWTENEYGKLSSVTTKDFKFTTKTVYSGNHRLQKLNIFDKLSGLGSLKSVKKYNSQNQLLEGVDYYYNSFDENSNENGTTQESFKSFLRGNRYRQPIDANGYYQPVVQAPYYLITSVSKTKFPNVLKSTRITKGNYTSTVYYDKHDFLTGEVLETRTITSDGKTYKTKIIPAYTKYGQMGSKVDDINNRNMLSQTAATYSYIQDAGNWKVTGVGITTWNNEWVYQDVGGNNSDPNLETAKEKIWRKHKSYIWNGVKDNNGIFLNYNDTNDDGFVWGVGQPQVNLKWKQTSEITLYDHYSMPLEVKDINGNKAATKMDVLNQKVEANGNAAYNEMYYSGTEIFSGGGFWVGQEVRNSNGIRTDVKAHTGKYSIAATNNTEFGAYMRNGHRAGKYKLSVWVHKDNVSKARVRATQYGSPTIFNGDNESVVAGDWVLKVHYFDVVAGDFYPYVTSSDSSPVYFDDLMIRPIASSITGYVYNEYDELTHIIGNNGLATRFEYDAAGRLVKTYVEIVDDTANGVTGGFKLKSENKYHYKNL